MKLCLTEKRKGMSFHAMRGCFAEYPSVEAFIASTEVTQVIATAKRFGDSLRVMEENPDESQPHYLRLEVC